MDIVNIVLTSREDDEQDTELERLDAVLDAELPRFADALERLGE